MLTFNIRFAILDDMAKQSDDLYTKRGAEALAERIERFWRSRGYRGVSAVAFQIPGFGMWGIRSNLIDGCPPRAGRA